MPGPGVDAMSAKSGDIIVGRIDGLFGIKGWVKIFSYTRPRDAILKYHRWRLKFADGWREFDVAEGRAQGPGVIARLAGVEERDAAATLVGAEIAIDRAQLPALKPGEYYWADLAGLKVVDLDGVELGTVSHLFETGGANDVMVVKGERERLIPYIASVIREVDLGNRIIRVDWDKDF